MWTVIQCRSSRCEFVWIVAWFADGLSLKCRQDRSLFCVIKHPFPLSRTDALIHKTYSTHNSIRQMTCDSRWWFGVNPTLIGGILFDRWLELMLLMRNFERKTLRILFSGNSRYPLATNDVPPTLISPAQSTRTHSKKTTKKPKL